MTIPIIINASWFHVTQPQTHLSVYSSHIKTPHFIDHFEMVLQKNTWKENFDPFAFVIVDTHTHQIALVRDHFGIQPLYYYYKKGKFIFGETIPDILQHLENTLPFDNTELTRLFSDQSIYSDNTFYQDIYRVEPGHILHVQSDTCIYKKPFWKLEHVGKPLHYQRDEDYLEHFTALMHEAVQIATRGHTAIATEFSGGIDSSAIYCTAAAQGVYPTPFLHEPLADSKAAAYNDATLKAMLEHYPMQNLQRIHAIDFDPLAIFEKYAKWFAGPAPYIFYMFAHPIHQAVSQSAHSILLSGFGGDQGVSSHLPAHFVLPELIHRKKYQSAWNYLGTPINPFKQPIEWIQRLRKFMQYHHPSLYSLNLKIRKDALSTPYHNTYHRTLREAECNLLQGPLSHEIRMRIEYSGIVSKKLGFEYRYPLLYPKLLEFFLQLPLEQKSRHGINRYLMRRYLSQYLPSNIFDHYKKSEGLHILPGSMEKFKRNYQQGMYEKNFKDLPFQEHIAQSHLSEQLVLIKLTHAYMLLQTNKSS